MADFFEKLSGSEKIDEHLAETPIVRKGETEEGQLAVDVFQTDNEIVIQSTIAGVKAADLDVTIQNDIVVIRGERKREIEVSPQDYFYQECYWGPFSRQIILPEEIDPDKTRAELKNGILTLWLPRLEKTKTTKVKIREIE
ncbi:MAG TPA: Hsp20/alpha crystallin family protein [Candidatus Pacearchaeota archaeon]|nr:Hsp20/alpha crystallin family protein [Candidatus Pacearchaeota archaeon]HOK94018.1 Hsp20/alpha crystallin family protein [Candidatus Pacearchaeota archaeon]HPO75089.1 Hsp20/alpha crystallin family protein [Candidatus Pacearchaeota archaeon]